MRRDTHYICIFRGLFFRLFRSTLRVAGFPPFSIDCAASLSTGLSCDGPLSTWADGYVLVARNVVSRCESRGSSPLRGAECWSPKPVSSRLRATSSGGLVSPMRGRRLCTRGSGAGLDGRCFRVASIASVREQFGPAVDETALRVRGARNLSEDIFYQSQNGLYLRRLIFYHKLEAATARSSVQASHSVRGGCMRNA